MVHALMEIWRVLVPGGFLIDLRPFHDKPPLESLVGEGVTPVGYIDASAEVYKDHAANAAIERMIEAELFILEQNDSFELRTYWDTSEAFLDYMDNRSLATLPADTRAIIEQGLPENATLRSRLNMIIARYRKSVETP